LRISGGTARGILLRINRTGNLRPAAEPVRQRLFSSIAPLLPGAGILDLCAGTGAYGLEGISRGAFSATFVEKDRKTVQNLKHNVEMVSKSAGFSSSATQIEARDVLEYLKKGASQAFNLVFFDPPYPQIASLSPAVFARLRAGGFLEKEGIVVMECPSEKNIEFEQWELIRSLGKEKRGSPVHRLYRPL
jgi:16S rRNA (guanine966-N2)-methyltransferase